MLDQALLNTLKSYLDQAHSVTIVCGADATIDILATTSVLVEALKSLEKDVRLVAPTKPDTSVIGGLEAIETTIGNQNLVISFPYEETAVDKVSYHIGENSGQFYLTIKPKKGNDPLDFNKVDFAYAGAESDAIILVGVTRLEELEQLYIGYEDFYETTTKISFTSNGSALGDVNISAIGYSSLSECVLVMLNSLGIEFSAESATNMLSAIDVETDYMRSLKASAITFEAVAQLMRVGARRLRPDTSDAQVDAKAEVSEGAEITVPVKKKKKTTKLATHAPVVTAVTSKKPTLKKKKRHTLSKKNDAA